MSGIRIVPRGIARMVATSSSQARRIRERKSAVSVRTWRVLAMLGPLIALVVGMLIVVGSLG